MQLLLLDEQQQGDCCDGRCDPIVTAARQHTGGEDDECSDLGCAVNISAAGCVIRHDHESTGTGEKDDRWPRESSGPKPAGESRHETEQRERAQAGEAGARTFGFSAPLPLDPDGHAGECRDAEIQERGRIERHERLLQLSPYLSAECLQASLQIVRPTGETDTEMRGGFEERTGRDRYAVFEKLLDEERGIMSRPRVSETRRSTTAVRPARNQDDARKTFAQSPHWS